LGENGKWTSQEVSERKLSKREKEKYCAWIRQTADNRQ